MKLITGRARTAWRTSASFRAPSFPHGGAAVRPRAAVASSWLALLCSVAFAAQGLAVERQQLTGHVPGVVARLKPVDRLPATQRLHLAIGLPLRDPAGLSAFLQDIYNPAGPNYHAYLTPGQFADRFGPSEQDFQAAIDFSKASGFTIKTNSNHANRLVLSLEGAVADIEKAFHLTLRVYQHPTEARKFFAPDTEPQLDLSVPVLHIGGLDNYVLPHSKSLKREPIAPGVTISKDGSGPGGLYLGGDFRAAYVPGTLLTGAGQTLALFELDGFFPGDIATYESIAGEPNVPVQVVLLDGFNGVPGFGNTEVALDIEVSIAMAPGLAGIISYEGELPETVWSQIASDDLANQVSCSWGWGGGPDKVLDQIFQEMGAQGQSVFDASGDTDAFAPGEVDDPNEPNAPSDDPYITQVGGTELTTTGPGGAWASETVWQEGFGVGSSGGISSYYTIPVWQQGVNMSTNGGSSKFRDLPDVALTAFNILVVADDGFLEDVGGTSCAAPMWAAFIALANQQAALNGEAPAGFLNPALYALAESQLYNVVFHDITTGNDTNYVSTNLFYAMPGYDLCTGWGTPTGTNLINQLSPPIGEVPLLGYVTNYIFGGNGNGAISPNECVNVNVVVTNFGGVAATDVRVTISSPTPGVIVVQPISQYGTIFTNSAATNLVPFQVSIAPTFPCGQPIEFRVALTSDQSVRQVAPRFRVLTGVPGTPLRYDNSASIAIPGFGQTNSPVVVSNVPSALAKVTVSLYANETTDADLALELIAPDGTTVTLTANNGGSGQDYGTSCSPDASRTTFDDDASTPIYLGVAPFLGSYSPQTPLSALIGKSGTNINGTWRLHAVGGYPLDTGALNCWSLFLTPFLCPPGGGQCPGADMAIAMSAVPDPVIIGNEFSYTMFVTNNGPSDTKSTVVTQPLPAGVQFLTASTSQGSYSFVNGIATFVLGPMAALSTAVITNTCVAIVPGDWTSTATVTSDQTDYNLLNNSATVVNHVLPLTADLAVNLSAAPSAPLVGEPLTYTVTVVNNGPSAASGVVLSNVLPSITALSSVTVSQGSAISYGNTVVCGFGSLVNGASATATIVAATLADGAATDSASVSGDQFDPNLANNSTNLLTIIGADADVSVSVVPSQNPVVLFSNLTYFITVSNAGPSTASSVVLTHNLTPSLSFVSMATSQGSVARAGNVITAALGTLASHGSALVTVNVIPTVQGPAQTTTSVVAAQPDPNPSNNSVTTNVVAAPAFISIVPAGATLVSESFTPANGAIENGETVTVSLRLRNAGNVSNTNLVATLLATNGVTPVAPNTPQTYGVLPPGSSFVAQNFSFTASGAPGATISAVLSLRDGSNPLANSVAYNFIIPTVFSFSNTNSIAILNNPNASLYPSTISVSGLTGIVGKVTATLSGFTHDYPKDVDVLLVAPTVVNYTLLMSHAADQPATNLTLTFDDDASTNMPFFGALSSATYKPTAYRPAPVFSNPAPAGAITVAALSSLNGISLNGTWSLFVQDDQAGDYGGISNGWSLALTELTPVNPLADLALTVTPPPSPSLVSANLTYSYVVTNGGPSSASNVIFTNPVPASLVFVSASASQGSIGVSGNAVIGALGSIAAGSTAAVSVVFAPTPAAAGLLVDTASVGATEIDLNPANNTASSTIQMVLPVADVTVTQSFAPNPAVAGFFFTNSIGVTNIGTNVALNVVLTELLPTNVAFASASSTVGACGFTNGLVTCDLGSFGPNAGAAVTLVLTPTVVSPVTLAPVATTASIDSNPTNNSVTNILAVNPPAPLLLSAGAAMLAESGPVNGTVDPGETVTVSLFLTNAGTADTSPNLSASLQNSGGVIPAANAQATYGVIAHGGAAVARPFTFTAASLGLATVSAGGTVTATLVLQDAQGQVTKYYTNAFVFVLPVRSTFASPQSIVIPSYGQGSPYPSTLTIPGSVTGYVSEATVNFFGLSHTFPSDINALLVSPSGSNVLLMAHAGANLSISNITIYFDDSGVPLPQSSSITSGTTYRPTAYTPRSLPAPAPQMPYDSLLADLDGWNASGTWSLYIFDDKVGDSGNINGWGLSLTIVNPLNPQTADVGLAASGPSATTAGSGVAYSLTVSNRGPSTATGVTLTDLLPAGATLTSASSSQGTYSQAGGVLTFDLGALDLGASATASLVVTPSHSGTLTNTVSATSQTTDLNLDNNSAQVVTSVTGLSIAATGHSQFALTFAGAAAGQAYIIQVSSDFSTWTPVSTNTTVAGSPVVFPIIPTASHAFYRVVPQGQ